MSAIPNPSPRSGAPGTWQQCGPASDRSAWHPLLAKFFDYWLSIRPAGELLPGRQHFDPIDIPDVMPRIWLLDVVRSGARLRFRYRLVGTKEVETLQQEVTGLWLDDVHPRLKENPGLLERFHHMVANGEPTYRKGRVNFSHKREHECVENCMVPLAADGRMVDIVAACSILYRSDGRES
jgi:PAS domain